jgi:RimJ/RimL family protein N-acetyltransferase
LTRKRICRDFAAHLNNGHNFWFVPRGMCDFSLLILPFLSGFPPAYSSFVSSEDTHTILETPRLALRQFTEGDVANMVGLDSDPAVMRYLGGRPTPRERVRDEIIPFYLDGYRRFDRLGTWAAEAAGTGEFLGWFHFRPDGGTDVTNVDLGYRLRRAVWNQGYATEGSRALIRMGFTSLGVERVYAHTLTINAASRRVMEKCGLTLVRTGPYEGPVPIEGAEHGEVEYALTKREWQALNAAGGQ